MLTGGKLQSLPSLEAGRFQKRNRRREEFKRKRRGLLRRSRSDFGCRPPTAVASERGARRGQELASTKRPVASNSASLKGGPISCRLVTGRGPPRIGIGIASAGLPAKFTAT